MRKLKATLVRSARVVRRALAPRRLAGAGFDRNYRSPVISLSTDITASGPNPMILTTPVIHLPLGQGERHYGNAGGYPSNPSLVTSLPISPTSEPGTELSPALARFRHLARGAAMVHRLMGLEDEAMAKITRMDQEPEEIFVRHGGLQVAKLVPKLQSMALTQDIAAHAALVRDMQVSVRPMTGACTFVMVFHSSRRMGSSWLPPAGIAPQLFSTSGYVESISCAIHTTECSNRSRLPPIECSCT